MVFAHQPRADVLRHFRFIFAQHGDVLINNFPLKFGKIVVIKVSAPDLYEMVLWSLIVQIIVCSLIKMR